MKSKQKQTPTEIIDNQRQAVVEKIIEDMKRDGLRWQNRICLPNTAQPRLRLCVSGRKPCASWLHWFMRGYTDNRWATFNQIKDAGWHVKKGAKSALIEKWKQFAFYKENEDTGEKELAGRYPKLVGYWNVFNAEDIEGIPPENAPVHLNDRTATIAQNLEESSRCPVIESSGYLGSAAYSPATDRILIAPRETFRSDEAFTRVLLHEMTHSTGHLPRSHATSIPGSEAPPMLRKNWSRSLGAFSFPQTSVSRAPIWRASSTRTTSPICNLG